MNTTSEFSTIPLLPSLSCSNCQFYEQTEGVSTDSLLSPVMAKFLREHFDELILSRAAYDPICWFKYFMTHSPQLLTSQHLIHNPDLSHKTTLTSWILIPAEVTCAIHLGTQSYSHLRPEEIPGELEFLRRASKRLQGQIPRILNPSGRGGTTKDAPLHTGGLLALFWTSPQSH
jgi:hypothetical protein